MTREEAIRYLGQLKNGTRIVEYHKALSMAVAALREQEERDNQKPLTLDELREMDCEPVWIKLFDHDEEFWVLRNDWVDTRNPEPMLLFHMRWYAQADYGRTWIAYRSKPKEENKDA